MPPIRKLDADLINKIAAGEVIERPASVVKELLENALDAGATRIDITLEDGGTRLIRVSDNGCGMARDELPLAVAAHATSKIYTAEDLFNIRSLGFRGEALASIAAVAHLRICTRRAEHLEACELTVTDGEPANVKSCAAPVGTTVEVRDIFCSVPVRRKFLRRPQTELGHATERLARVALAHPNVAFSLVHNGRTTRDLPTATDPAQQPDDGAGEPARQTTGPQAQAADPKPRAAGHDPQSSIDHPQFATRNPQSLAARRARIADFYGAELADCLIALDRTERGVRIEALIAPPDQSRASTKWQYLFLNGRFITDRRIGYAVREAFRGLVEHDRFPVVFIFLTTDPDRFDVNVHPTKLEVRWRDAGLIQSQVLAVLRETLLTHDLTPRLRTAQVFDGTATPADVAHQQHARQALADYLKSIDPTQARIAFQPPRFPTPAVRPSIASTFTPPPNTPLPETRAPEEPPTQRADVYQAGPSVGERTAGPQAFPAAQEAVDPSAESGSLSPGDAATAAGHPGHASRSVMQIHNTYIVAQTEEGIVIIDQHALHERILYEKFRQRILSGPLEAQGLLIPQTLEASPAQVQAAEQHRAILRRLGIELSAFGPAVLAVQGFPSLLQDVEVNLFVGDLLDKLAETGGAESEETLIHAALDMMACKAAVKAGDVLTTEEMHALLAQRHLTDRSSNCPHGRPTTLQLSTRDLEKQFKRI